MSAAALHSSSSLMAILLLFLLVTLSTASPSPSGCSSELVRFSQCLPYVASPPNNLSHAPPSKCCEAFSSAVESGTAVCLCYLLENPAMLGFPVSGDRVISLSSLCPLNSSTSLDSICSGTQQLPPLRNTTTTTTTPVIPSPNSPGSSDLRNTSIPVIARPPPPGLKSASSTSNGTVPEATKNSSSEPVRVSSANFNNNTSWFLPAVAIILLI